MSCLLNEPGDSAKTSSVLASDQGEKLLFHPLSGEYGRGMGLHYHFYIGTLLMPSSLCQLCVNTVRGGGSLNGPVSQAAEVPGSREREQRKN